MGYFLKPKEISDLVIENIGEVDDMELDDFMYLMACLMVNPNIYFIQTKLPIDIQRICYYFYHLIVYIYFRVGVVVKANY